MNNAKSEVVQTKETWEILEVLGIRNADVFTYDHILFVEGPSDEKVFGAVLDRFSAQKEIGRIKIVPLGGDSEFKKRKNRLQLIKLLLAANAAEAKVCYTFLFDSNDWAQQEKIELEHLASTFTRVGIYFLARPQLEDYLLHPPAIAAVIRRIERKFGGEASTCAPERVAAILEEESGDAVERLSQVFSEYSIPFSKNAHDELIIEQMPDCKEVIELHQELKSALLRSSGAESLAKAAG
jgi:hypothetical protein